MAPVRAEPCNRQSEKWSFKRVYKSSCKACQCVKSGTMTKNVSDFNDHLRILQTLPSVEDSEPHDLALREILRFLMSHEGYNVHRSGIDGFDEQIHLWAIQEKAIETQGTLTLEFPLDRTQNTLGIHRSSSPIRLTPNDGNMPLSRCALR